MTTRQARLGSWLKRASSSRRRARVRVVGRRGRTGLSGTRQRERATCYSAFSDSSLPGWAARANIKSKVRVPSAIPFDGNYVAIGKCFSSDLYRKFSFTRILYLRILLLRLLLSVHYCNCFCVFHLHCRRLQCSRKQCRKKEIGYFAIMLYHVNVFVAMYKGSIPRVLFKVAVLACWALLIPLSLRAVALLAPEHLAIVTHQLLRENFSSDCWETFSPSWIDWSHSEANGKIVRDGQT